MATDVSYWQQTLETFALSSALPREVEVVVIGGGLLGAATCYWLARADVQVALLEQTAIAAGASGRNGGFVRMGPAGSYAQARERLGTETALAVMYLTEESQALLRMVCDDEAIACDYREPGTLRLAITDAQRDQYRREIELLNADGFAAEWLERAQVQKLLSVPLAPDILGARFRPQQGLVHSAKLVQGLVRAAVDHGARAYLAEVISLQQEGGQVHIHTSQGDLIARTVIVAINAWTSRLLPALKQIIVPVLEQMLAYAPLEPLFPVGIGVDLIDGEYCQQTPSGHILIGGCGTLEPNAGFGVWESLPTAPVQQALEQVLPRLFPSLATQLQVVQRWAGLMGYTTDQHPIVDAAPGLPGVFCVGGFSGHGMPFGLRLGQLLAATAVQRDLHPALAPFRLDRPSLNPWTNL